MRDDLEMADRIQPIVTRALERKPEIAVPENFAVRIAQSMPAKGAARAELRPVFGRAAGYASIAVMMVVLLILAEIHPQALEAGRGFLFAVELLLVAQLLAVGLWLGMRNGGA